jgi:hypothetical protein
MRWLVIREDRTMGRTLQESAQVRYDLGWNRITTLGNMVEDGLDRIR